MISEANTNNLNRIAEIHQVVLKDTFTSRVGKGFIESLYRVLLNNKSFTKVFIAEEGGEVEGFISLTENRLMLNDRVNQGMSFAQKFGLVLFVLLHPGTIKDLFNKIRFDGYIARHFKDTYPSILTLGVSPKYQGKGLGRALIIEADTYFKNKRVQKYYVDTETGNRGAVQFYLKSGFKPLATISGNIILEKDLAKEGKDLAHNTP